MNSQSLSYLVAKAIDEQNDGYLSKDGQLYSTLVMNHTHTEIESEKNKASKILHKEDESQVHLL